MNDIQLNKIEVNYELPTIDYEITPLKEQVDKIKGQYSNWVVAEDDIKDAKKTVANINKAAKAISDKRITIARAVKEPLSKFEDDIKLLTAELKEVSSDIKDQLDDYEQKRKADKQREIMNLDGFSEFIVFNDKWLNKTYAITKIEDEIEEQQKAIDSAKKAISTTALALKLDPQDYYDRLKHTELSDILDEIQHDADVRNKYAEKPESVTVTSNEETDDTVYTRKLSITGTKMQIKALKEFLDDTQITYEVL